MGYNGRIVKNRDQKSQQMATKKVDKMRKVFCAALLSVFLFHVDALAQAYGQPPYLVSPDGQYLGNLGSKYDPNSINNPYGRYGSKYSSDSINNPYGQYGSRYSNQSPHNPYANQQPILINPNTGTSNCFGGSPYGGC
jgi:hypothetical protein